MRRINLLRAFRRPITLLISFGLSLLLTVAQFPLWSFTGFPLGANHVKAQSTGVLSTAQTDSELSQAIQQAQELQLLGFYRRALLTLTDLQPALATRPNSRIKISGLHLLGNLLRTTGDLDASRTALEQGLAIAKRIDAAHAPLFLSLGHTAEASKDISQAKDYYQRAIQSATNTDLRLRSRLSLLAVIEDPTAAKILSNRTQSELDTLTQGNDHSRATLNIRLALAKQQLDSLEQQIASLAQIARNLTIAQQEASALGDARAESYALGYLGELYQTQQQFPDAELALSRALDIANNLQAADLTYQWSWKLGLIEKESQKTTAAIAYYETAVDALQAMRGNLIAIAPDLRFDFAEQVEPVYRGYVDLLLSSAESSDNPSATLTKARQTIESLQIAELENYFQEPCVPVSQQLDSVVESAASPTAVIYPVILSDRTEIILKLPQQPLKQYTVPVSQTELETLLARLQRNLRLPYTINAVQSDAVQLYNWLIAPIEADLNASQIDTLAFVLDGFLRSIPMSVLFDGDRYLVEKYSIALAPGLQLVDPRPLEDKQLATIIAGLSEPPQAGFSALPFVIDEVESIQQSTPSRVLLNETFTKDNLEAAINSTPYPLVHLATHGQFSSDPNETFILAWDNRIQVNELNRILRQSEQNRQAAIELLILSACETAVGDKRAALGIAGIAVQAGARSTLASLWNLDDQSSALFSDYFYQELANSNLSKAQALRNAQLKILGGANTSAYQHPLYWAPYILLGNWL